MSNLVSRNAVALAGVQKELRHCATVPVYFARADRTGEIKIGFSTQVHNRIAHLGWERFSEMTLLGWKRGGPAMERKMHAKFSDFALGREWFEPDPSLVHYIAEKTRHDDPPHVASKYGRINDTHFNTLVFMEKHYSELVTKEQAA